MEVVSVWPEKNSPRKVSIVAEGSYLHMFVEYHEFRGSVIGGKTLEAAIKEHSVDFRRVITDLEFSTN